MLLDLENEIIGMNMSRKGCLEWSKPADMGLNPRKGSVFIENGSPTSSGLYSFPRLPFSQLKLPFPSCLLSTWLSYLALDIVDSSLFIKLRKGRYWIALCQFSPLLIFLL